MFGAMDAVLRCCRNILCDDNALPIGNYLFIYCCLKEHIKMPDKPQWDKEFQGVQIAANKE